MRMIHRRRDLRQAARQRPRTPYRQGDLDGLCGVYSAVNAVRALCPEIDTDDTGWLFDHLIQQLPKAGANVTLAVANGIVSGELAHLIDKAVRYMANEHDIDLSVSRLPKALRRTADIDGLWAALADAVSPTCVAVIGLSGRYWHWTVAVEVTPGQLRLFDSDRLGVLRRKRCTVAKAVTRTSIAPSHVFLVTRRDVE